MPIYLSISDFQNSITTPVNTVNIAELAIERITPAESMQVFFKLKFGQWPVKHFNKNSH